MSLLCVGDALVSQWWVAMLRWCFGDGVVMLTRWWILMNIFSFSVGSEAKRVAVRCVFAIGVVCWANSRKSPRFYHWRSFLIRNVYLLLSTLVFFVLEVWQCLTTWFGRQLKSLCPGGIVVAERDGHAIARISPGATFGECLGHEIIINYELLWAGLTLYCVFRMKCLRFMWTG